MVEEYVRDGEKPDFAPSIAPTLASKGPQIPKEQVIETHHSRGLKTKDNTMVNIIAHYDYMIP
jgi:hypothetical protein